MQEVFDSSPIFTRALHVIDVERRKLGSLDNVEWRFSRRTGAAVLMEPAWVRFDSAAVGADEPRHLCEVPCVIDESIPDGELRLMTGKLALKVIRAGARRRKRHAKSVSAR